MLEECRHIRVNGTKCEANALRGQAWCYFHQRIYRDRTASPHPRTLSRFPIPQQTLDYGCVPVPSTATPDAIVDLPTGLPADLPIDLPIDLPLIEDISSVQLAISRIVHALAANTIQPRRAGLLLYGLQVASQSMPKNSGCRTVSQVAYTEDDIPFDATPYYYATPEPEEEDAEEHEHTAEEGSTSDAQRDDTQNVGENSDSQPEEKEKDPRDNLMATLLESFDDEDEDEDDEEDEEVDDRPLETCAQLAARLHLNLQRPPVLEKPALEVDNTPATIEVDTSTQGIAALTPPQIESRACLP